MGGPRPRAYARLVIALYVVGVLAFWGVLLGVATRRSADEA
ncbi:MAG: hypothetical protein ACREPI_07075 [Candidatus Dormibacterales bacterium]